MNLRKDLGQRLAAFAAASAILLALAGCQGSGSNGAANSNGASNSNNPELFTIPQDQMSHVQVLTVAAHNFDAISPANGSRGLQQFSHHAGHHAGERACQPSGGGSGTESNVRVSPCCTWRARITRSSARTT